MQKISVVIISFNEEKNIERCIRSVEGIADEVLIVDSFSTDQTKQISESLGATVLQQTFLGYSGQKNFANQKATYDLIFSLDADEAVSPALKKALLQIKSGDTFGEAYEVNRINNYCGKWIRYCGWYPDRKIRLFNRNDAYWEGTLHEKLLLNKNIQIKRINSDLEHYPYYTIQDHTKQVENYTHISSLDLYNNHKKASFIKLVFAGPVRFFSDYVLKRGFLDGYAGFRISKISAYATFLKYAKLKELMDKDKALNGKK